VARRGCGFRLGLGGASSSPFFSDLLLLEARPGCLAASVAAGVCGTGSPAPTSAFLPALHRVRVARLERRSTQRTGARQERGDAAMAGPMKDPAPVAPASVRGPRRTGGRRSWSCSSAVPQLAQAASRAARWSRLAQGHGIVRVSPVWGALVTSRPSSSPRAPDAAAQKRSGRGRRPAAVVALPMSRCGLARPAAVAAQSLRELAILAAGDLELAGPLLDERLVPGGRGYASSATSTPARSAARPHVARAAKPLTDQRRSAPVRTRGGASAPAGAGSAPLIAGAVRDLLEVSWILDMRRYRWEPAGGRRGCAPARSLPRACARVRVRTRL